MDACGLLDPGSLKLLGLRIVARMPTNSRQHVLRTVGTSCVYWRDGRALVLVSTTIHSARTRSRGRISFDPSTIALNPGGVPYLDQLHTGLDPNDVQILRRWGSRCERHVATP